MPTNKPTINMRNALLKFKIPAAEVDKMDYDQASAKLKILIDRAKEHDANPSGAGGNAFKPTFQSHPAPITPANAVPAMNDAVRTGQANQSLTGRLQPAQQGADTPTTARWLSEAKKEIEALNLGSPTQDSPVLASVLASKTTIWSTLLIHRDNVKKYGWKE
jgi:hypothetical protein